MRVLNYQGGEDTVAYRHPDNFTVLAPKRMQQACRDYGGVPVLTSKPRFRMALVASRYQLVGGQEVTKLDSNKNRVSSAPEELFIPKYRVEEHQQGAYILEMWRPAEWFYQNRYDMVSVEYGSNGKSYRQMEPIWADGAYVGMMWKFEQPFVFPRDVAIESTHGISIRWALWAACKSLEHEFDYEQELKRSRAEVAAQRAANREEYKAVSYLRGRSGMFLEPTISMCG